MSVRSAVVLTVTALLAGTAGWTLRGLTIVEAPVARAPGSTPVAVAAPPSVAARVSIAETRPEPAPAGSATAAAQVAPPPELPEGGEPAPRTTASLLEALRRGDEPDRYQGLLGARPGEVPPELLRQLLETDESDRVRLAALEIVMESLAGHEESLRALLDEARLVPNAALQQEAERRLVELEARVRRAASQPQEGDRP